MAETTTIQLRPNPPFADLEVQVGEVAVCFLRVQARLTPVRWSDPARYRKTPLHRAVEVLYYLANGHYYWVSVSLERAGAYLAQMGLDPEPLFTLARQQGWEDDLVNAAAAYAALLRPTTWVGPLIAEAAAAAPVIIHVDGRGG